MEKTSILLQRTIVTAKRTQVIKEKELALLILRGEFIIRLSFAAREPFPITPMSALYEVCREHRGRREIEELPVSVQLKARQESAFFLSLISTVRHVN